MEEFALFEDELELFNVVPDEVEAEVVLVVAPLPVAVDPSVSVPRALVEVVAGFVVPDVEVPAFVDAFPGS